MHAGQEHQSEDEALHQVAAAFLEQCTWFFEEHRQELLELALPSRALLQLLSASLKSFVRLEITAWRLPEADLEALPERARIFLRPRRTRP